MSTVFVKLVVTTPVTHADRVRNAMGQANAGLVGNYGFCTFSIKGKGRYLPLKNANPYIGKIDELSVIEEERIETVCLKKDIKKIVDAIKKVHPYEEIAFDIYPLLVNPEKISRNQFKK